MSAGRRKSSRPATALVVALLLASCSGESPNVNPTSTSAAPKPAVIERQADGILRIGFLVPVTDPQAPFGPELAPIVASIVEIMNAFGGFNEGNVELVIRDEGTTPESAKKEAIQLAEVDKVDAVVGPFSSINALSVVPILVSAGVGVCSPSVSARVMNYIEDDGLFIRTSTLDTEIIKSMADLAVQSGRKEVSLAFPDDPYGRNLARELIDALDLRGLDVLTQIAYPISADDYQLFASRLTADAATVELLIGDPIDGPRVLNALVKVAPGAIIITNDAVVNTEVLFDAAISLEERPQIFGAIPDTQMGSETLLNIFRFTSSDYLGQVTQIPSFTANTIDCLTLIWLAARHAKSDNPENFKKEFLDIANDGSRCNWLFTCDFIFDRTLNLDYEGVTSLTLDELGNAISRGTLIFTINAEGRAEIVEGLPNFIFSDSG